MFSMKMRILFFATLVNWLSLVYAATTTTPKPSTNASCDDSGKIIVRTANLCTEFQILRDVVPRRELFAIASRHYRYDRSFRRSMQFLHTSKFASIARQIERSRPYRWMLSRFENASINVTDIATIANILNCILLPVSSIDVDYGNGGGYGDPYGSNKLVIVNKNYNRIELNAADLNTNRVYNREHYHNDKKDDDLYDEDWNDNFDEFDDYGDYAVKNGIQSRSLQTFAMDIMRAIPQDELRETIESEMEENEQFANFYKIMRLPSFRQEVMRGLNSRQLASAMRILRRNGIDVRKLITYLFKIFSWGP